MRACAICPLCYCSFCIFHRSGSACDWLPPRPILAQLAELAAATLSPWQRQSAKEVVVNAATAAITAITSIHRLCDHCNVRTALSSAHVHTSVCMWSETGVDTVIHIIVGSYVNANNCGDWGEYVCACVCCMRNLLIMDMMWHIRATHLHMHAYMCIFIQVCVCVCKYAINK